ncbi:hypothetical protein ES705_50531 [subsurface metagenome]
MGTQIIRPPTFQRPSGHLYLGTLQTNLMDGMSTLVLLDTIKADFKDGIENIVTHRITPGKAGFYSVYGHIQFISIVADKCYTAYLKKSGGFAVENPNHASFVHQIGVDAFTPCYYFSEIDYVELWAKSESGTDEVDISTVHTRLIVQRVR